MTVQERIKGLQGRVEKARENSALSAQRVTLLGASKGQPEPLIKEAIAGGLSDFGENRVQEAETKWQAIRARHPDVRLHLIGPLQSNKARQAVELFDIIQTIDRESVADAVAEAIARANRKNFSCYIQVNTGEEPQKAGVIPSQAEALIAHCRSLQLPLAGLMCIPPVDQPPAPHFALLRQIAQKHNLNELSMGMSDDFEIAVRMGSTCVRLGRALFGERN